MNIFLMAANTSCLPTVEKPYKKWYLKVNENIGEKSRYGKVYIVCDKKDDCSYVMKVIRPFRNPGGLSVNRMEAKKSFKKEVEMQNKCSSTNICLKVEDSWSCNGGEVNVIITRLLQKTVLRYLQLLDDNEEKFLVLKKLMEIIFTLHFNTLICHHDTHLNNFMVDYKGNIKMIDLGLSQDIGFDENGSLLKLYDICKQILTDYTILLGSIEIYFQNFEKISLLKKFIKKLEQEFEQIYEIFHIFEIKKSSKIKIPDTEYCKTRNSYLEFSKEKYEKARKHNHIDLISILFLLVGVEKLVVEKYLNL